MGNVHEFTRIATASRAFSLAAAFGLALAFQNESALSATVVVSVVAAVAVYLAVSAAVANQWLLAAEALVATLVVVQALPASGLLIPYLVALTLLAGLSRGLRGAVVVGLFQVTGALALVLASEGMAGVDSSGRTARPVEPHYRGSRPAGCMGSIDWQVAWRVVARPDLRLRSKAARAVEAAGSPYAVRTRPREHGGADVVHHRRQGRLLSAGRLRSYRRRSARTPRLPRTRRSGVPRSQRPACPRVLEDGVDSDRLRRHRRIVRGGWVRSATAPRGRTSSASSPDVGRALEQDEFEALQPTLDELSLRLATALAFDEFRALVTTDERQRLAREIHDGVAQEVASLGYVLDDLAAASSDPDLVRRGSPGSAAELGRVVTELRMSIFDLRSDVGDGPGLGAALSEYARLVGARSSMKVHLTLDESPTRLSPGVEAELFRIAQEAITNARKHSGAANLWVDCWVRSPAAHIRVRDDGRGLGAGRSDSYGLRIMRERADRIEARVHVDRASDNRDRPGTCVTVAIGNEEPPMLKRVGAGAA